MSHFIDFNTCRQLINFREKVLYIYGLNELMYGL